MRRAITLMIIIAFVLSFTVMTVQAEDLPTADTQVTILENYAALGTRTMWHEDGNNQFIPAVFADGASPTRKDETDGNISTKDRGDIVFNGTTVGIEEPGAWVEYDLEVPVTGTYKVAFNYSTGDVVSNDKTLFLDVEVGSVKSTIDLPGTGGWGGNLEDYHIVVVDKEIKLTAGTNTVKLTRLTDGHINLDVVGLAYAPDGDVTFSRSDDFASVQATTAAWAEAEDPTNRSDEGIQEKERGPHISQGITNSFHTDAAGSWTEYDLDVPASGIYKVILSYGTARTPSYYYTDGANEFTESDSIRPLTYKFSFGDQGVIADLEGSGGWGTNGREEIIDAVVEKEFFLEAGTQTLRVDRLHDQINMDWIGIQLVNEQDAPSPSTSDNSMLISLLAVMLLSGAFLTWRKLSSVR